MSARRESSEPRVALITGGARGIGRAIAQDLARNGWRVAVCYRTSADDAAELVVEIETAGGEATAERCDVSDPGACADLVDTVVERWGSVHALVNGAGPYTRVPLLESSVPQWHEMFDNNLHPVFYLARLVAPWMQKQGWGRIITFAMANADKAQAQPQLTAHYISKVGVLVLTRSLAKALGRDGITVNAISPGFIDSGSAPMEELAPMVKNIPAGHIGHLDDAVAVARFLLSDEARYVNGANVQVSGGWGV